MNDIEASVKRAISEVLCRDVSDFGTATTLDEMNCDSLDVVEIRQDLEEDFDIELTDEEVAKVRTVGDVITLVTLKKQKACAHYWIPNSGQGGEPVFKPNRMMSPEPTMHAMCSLCKTRTWFTEKQWNAIPATLPPEPARG